MNAVNHPDHYNKIDVECIEVVKYYDFTIGNAIKYLWRAGNKDSVHQDLAKARWYLQYAIKEPQQLNPCANSFSHVIKRDGTPITVEELRVLVADSLPLGLAIAALLRIEAIPYWETPEHTDKIRIAIDIIDAFLRSIALDSALGKLSKNEENKSCEHENLYMESREKIMCKDCEEEVTA